MPKNPRVPVDIVAQTKKFDRQIKTAFSAAGGAAVAFGAAAAAAMVALTKEVLKLSGELNQIAKDARRVGQTVEEFQKVKGALELLTDGTVNAAQAIQEYQDRTGNATLDLAAFADEMAAIKDPAERTSRAIDVFGARVGRAMAGLTDSDAVREAIADIERAGVVSSEAALQAEDLEDAVLLLQRSVDNLRIQTLAPLQVVLSGVATTMSSLAQDILRDTSWDDYGAAIRTAFLDVGVPALATFKVLALDVIALSKPIRETSSSLTLMARAAERFASGDFKYAGALWEKSNIRAQQAAFSMLALGDQFKRNRKGAEDLIRTLRDLTATTAETAAGGGAGGGGEAGKDRIEVEKEVEDTVAVVVEKAEKRKRVAIEKTAELRELTAGDYLSMSADTMGAVAGLVSAVSDIEISKTEETSKARQDALRKAWEAQTVVAIAQAALNIPLSISQASAAGYPAAVGFMIAAGAASTIALAGVIAKAAAGPKFHSGGDVDAGARLGRSRGAPDEVNATLLLGERVQSRAEVRAAGAGRPIIVVNQVGPRVVDAQTHEALRTGTGTLARQFRQVRPRRVGRHNMYSGI